MDSDFIRLRLDSDPAIPTTVGGGAVSPDPEPIDSSAVASEGLGDRSDLYAPSTSTSDSATTAAAQMPADPNQRANPATTDWQSIRDAASAQGFQFGADITDDRQALNFLLQRAMAPRQQSIHEQLGRQLAPRAQEILGFLQGQPGRSATPARQSWEAPEFDERWASLVERDPATGLFFGKPGTPDAIVGKVNEYVEWKSKFDRNPAAVLNEMVESRAKQIARDTFQEQFAESQRSAVIQQIVEENNEWLYQRGQNGQPLRTFDGQPVTTPVGARYIHHLQTVSQMGVTDPRQQDALAKQLVRGDWAIAQSHAASSPGQLVAQARPNVNPLAAQPPLQRRSNPAAPPETTGGKSLSELLREDLAAEGVTDRDVFESVGLG